MRIERFLLLCVVTAILGCSESSTVSLDTKTENVVLKPVANAIVPDADVSADDEKAKQTKTTDEPKSADAANPAKTADTETKKLEKKMPKFNELTAQESYVILKKGTERAGTGEYWQTKTLELISVVVVMRHCTRAPINSKATAVGQASMMKSKVQSAEKWTRMDIAPRSCAPTAADTWVTCSLVNA